MIPASSHFTEHHSRLFWSGIAIGLLLMAIAFWPGLAGPFLFDDFGSIGDLGRYGGVDNWHTFKQFIFGGSTGPTGRPLSLLSFLIDGNNWPTDPWPFKRTNLVIHGINALLVGLLCRQMLDVMQFDATRAVSIAVFCAVAWAVHPFLVSTVLYPVQRMAQLTALFSLAGLNLYLHGRRRLTASPRAAYLTMSIALVGCSALATLSKENGALTPMLVGVLEVTVVASQIERLGRLNRIWGILFIALPSAFIFAYLLRIGLTTNLFAQGTSRDFSAYERLLTQGRIVFDYLRHWFLPSLYTAGIFQDHFDKSTGLLQPVSTLVALLLHATIIAGAWLNRIKRPLLAFALLFFYAGHLLESTIISLELYFEHRNYLPTAFLFLPAAAWVSARVPGRAAMLLAAVVVLVLGGFTRYSSTIWRSYPAMVETAARAEPRSARAQQQYAALLFNRQQTADAIAVTDSALQLRPNDKNLNLWYAILLCKAGTLRAEKFDEIADVIGRQSYDLRGLNGYETLISTIEAGECRNVSPAQLRRLFERLLTQPVNANPAGPMFAQVTYLKGQADLLLDDPASALTSFRASLDSRPGAGRAMAMAAALASRGYFEEAMALSNKALAYFGDGGDLSGMATGVTRDDILNFQSQLRDAMEP